MLLSANPLMLVWVEVQEALTRYDFICIIDNQYIFGKAKLS